MLEQMIAAAGPVHEASSALLDALATTWNYVLIILGFSVVIFFHELGHFLAAKACGVRVDKFAIGFYRELVGFSWGETRYSFNILPLGGYVKMLGQEDFSDKSGELQVKHDPRSFTHKPVGQRMFIVSAGVIMNVIFAAVLFMIAFMMGMKSLPAEIGWIEPGSPAEEIGLRVGDRIVRINDDPIADQQDLKMAIILADPDEPLELTFQREDPAGGPERLETATIRPERSEEQNILRIGVAPPMNTTVGLVLKDPTLADDTQLQIGDEILEVNGRPITHFAELHYLLADLKGQFAKIRVRRPTPAAGAATLPSEAQSQEKEVQWRANLTLVPVERNSTGNLLGLLPRLRISDVAPNSQAEQAGLMAGDVVVRWGNQVSPRLDEIVASVEANADVAIPVQVLRYKQGQPEVFSCKVTPRRSGMLGRGAPRVGITWRGQGQESDRLVVADVIESGPDGQPTPAAKLRAVFPRGAMIVKVNDVAVNSWPELTAQFIKLAGTEVKLAWAMEGQHSEGAAQGTASMYVPHTLGTTFDLPGSRLITAIDGKASVEIEKDGNIKAYSVDHWIGAREMLKASVGKTVPVEFWDRSQRQLITKELTVTPEMVDPWVLRIAYNVSDVITNFESITVRETNPFKAMMLGVRKTIHFIEQVYLTMQRMIFTRSMDLDQVSGPVGIIKAGSDLAAVGTPVLLYFLALISANLAVINFLPLPIFDGGLFVFLIIEKIKGKPISLKVQVVTQMIGIFLIIGIFLFVTFQDIAKLAGWG